MYYLVLKSNKLVSTEILYQCELYQFFMRLHRISIPPNPPGGMGDKILLKVPRPKGDLGGSRYVQLHIKLVLPI